MEDLLNSNVAVEPGAEQQYIHEQRLKIKELHDKLNAEKQRKNDLHDKLRAYNEIKQRLAEKGGNKEENLQELMTEFQEKKTKMQQDMDKNITVQLYKRAYDIDYDAY